MNWNESPTRYVVGVTLFVCVCVRIFVCGTTTIVPYIEGWPAVTTLTAYRSVEMANVNSNACMRQRIDLMLCSAVWPLFCNQIEGVTRKFHFNFIILWGYRNKMFYDHFNKVHFEKHFTFIVCLCTLHSTPYCTTINSKTRRNRLSPLCPFLRHFLSSFSLCPIRTKHQLPFDSKFANLFFFTLQLFLRASAHQIYFEFSFGLPNADDAVVAVGDTTNLKCHLCWTNRIRLLTFYSRKLSPHPPE